MRRRLSLLTCLSVVILALSASIAVAAPTAASVGKSLFFDPNLSYPVGQSCASCHDPAVGFADPRSSQPVSPGAVMGVFGNRNSPSAAYASMIPPRSFDTTLGTYVGGLFLDGRVNTLQAQAGKPFLNPNEMHMPNRLAVVMKVNMSSYAKDFRTVFGAGSLDVRNPSPTFDRITQAIATYEQSAELNPFTSKHDYAMTLTGSARMMTFTMQERQGMMLFNGKAKCSVCHATPMSGMGGGMGGGGMGGGGMGGGMGSVVPTMPILFSDYRYANLGIPKNTASPYLTNPYAYNPAGASYIDHGLASALSGGLRMNPRYDGMFRTPSLRNVALTAPYGHNGYFMTLKQVVHFYNTRDVAGAGWAAPEVNANLETATVGNLMLTSMEEDALVAFLGTLNDGWWIKP